MRNIDEIRAEIKDFYSEQKLALKDLPNILATDEKIIGLSKTYYDKLKIYRLIYIY